MLQPRLLTCSPRCFSRYEDVNVHVELLIVIFFFFFEGFSIFLLGFYSIPFYFIIKFSLFLLSDQLVCLMDIFYYIFYYFRILFII